MQATYSVLNDALEIAAIPYIYWAGSADINPNGAWGTTHPESLLHHSNNQKQGVVKNSQASLTDCCDRGTYIQYSRGRSLLLKAKDLKSCLIFWALENIYLLMTGSLFAYGPKQVLN